jgi:SecD/SecF fusion protein
MSKYENSNWSDPSTTVNYSFLNQYILAFGQADKKTPASDADIPANSFLKIIPNKNPTNTKEDSNFQWLTINTNSRYEARQVLNGVKNFAFELPLKVVNVAYVPPPSTGSTGLFNTITNNISTIEQPFSSNVFGMKPIVGLVVSLGLILLGIGILISILYRVPGAFGIASIIATFGLTLMIMVLSNYVLSMGLFIGLLIGLFGATIALFS